MTFHVALSGAAMSACISGLTVVGTGSVRAGTSSGPRAGVWAVPAGSNRTIATATNTSHRATRSVMCE